ncbi:MAG: TIGR04255 family protein [Candidatus Marinimicrobia bacterium]|nr:TIGR04255 family protein [Candidatus Neomarinimicrobiota bacterium]
MSISEVFPNPTVKQVIFQIKFPNLFYMENKIGAFQLKIMNEFPQSALLFRRQVVFVDIGPEGKFENIPADLDKESGKKIWQFKSNKNFQLNVLGDSLGIVSQYHKTYNLEGGDKFRDIIKFVLDYFFEVTSIPLINRIGLRYIDECPLPSKDNDTFRLHYNSIFPVDRFNIANANEMDFKTVTKTGEYYLRYIESLKKVDSGYKLILDFDGFAENINSEDYLTVTDELHTIILEEYEKTIREPVYQYMRQKKEE